MRHHLVLAALPLLAISFPSGARAQESEMNGATYTVRLQDLQTRADEVQDEVRRSRARLAAISAALAPPDAARVDIDVVDATSAAFKLASAKVFVDGALQYARQDGLDHQKTLPVFSGAFAPGDHTVKVDIVLRGNGFGVFTYLRGYTIALTSTHSFTTAGKPLHVTATAYESSDVTIPFERRPQLGWSKTNL